jgi:hypothetical protein
MARITYSGLVTNIRGSVGGTTFQTNKYGFTIKNKANMVHPRTSLQGFQKLALSVAISQWTKLSDSTRTLWNTWATSFPQYAKHNPSAQLSGFNCFVRRQVYDLMYFGLDQSAMLTPEMVSYPLDTCTVALDQSGTVFTLTPTWNLADETLTCFYFITGPLKDSVNFVGTRPKYIGSNYNINDPINITQRWLNAYGDRHMTGYFVVVELQIVANSNGQVFARSQQRIQFT